MFVRNYVLQGNTKVYTFVPYKELSNGNYLNFIFMESKYENLEKLNELYQKGIISESEYNAEKAKILEGEKTIESPNKDKDFSMWMHLSQFSNCIIPGGGFIIPIVMWMSRKEKPFVDVNGKIILNWKISLLIYFVVVVLISVFTGIISIPITNQTGDPSPALFWSLGTIVFPILFFGIVDFIFIIIGAVKASKGEIWNYPLSIRFFKTKTTTEMGEEL